MRGPWNIVGLVVSILLGVGAVAWILFCLIAAMELNPGERPGLWLWVLSGAVVAIVSFTAAVMFFRANKAR